MDMLTEVLRLFIDEEIEFKNVVEFLALASGDKPVVRIAAEPARLERIEACMRPLGIGFRRSPMGLKRAFSNNLADVFYTMVPTACEEAELQVGFFGRDDRLEGVIQAELSGCDDVTSGQALGYPSCCSQNYAQIRSGIHWITPYMGKGRGSVRAPWIANKVAYLFPPGMTLLPDYFPCSSQCQATCELARRNQELLKSYGLGALLDDIRSHLVGTLLVAGGEILFGNFSEPRGEGWVELLGRPRRLKFSAESYVLPEEFSRFAIRDGMLLLEGGTDGKAAWEFALEEGEGSVDYR